MKSEPMRHRILGIHLQIWYFEFIRSVNQWNEKGQSNQLKRLLLTNSNQSNQSIKTADQSSASFERFRSCFLRAYLSALIFWCWLFSFQYYQCDFHLFFDNVKLGQMESNWLTCRRSCWGGGTRWEARWWGSPVNVKYLIKSKLLFRRFSDNLEPKKIIQDIFKDCNYQRKSLHLPSSPTCCLNIWSDHKYVTRVPLFIV